MCGHATLATAFVLFNFENHSDNLITFYSPRSGDLTVTKEGYLLSLNFPVDQYEPIALTSQISEAFEIAPQKAFKGKTDYMLLFKNEDEILNLKPNLDIISKFNVRGIIVTAKGNQTDFVSRFFAPQSGIIEDPVTGSAHTTLIPYWSKELNKTKLSAIQLSERRGYLECELLQDRVRISGKAKCYMIGEIFLK
ncbi:MAG: PhzF family phenazine biosynthesis protein [Bacteroidota bacterium]